MILLFLGVAQAKLSVCVDIATNFVDTGGTDYFVDNGPKNARYLRMRAAYIDADTQQWVTSSGYADRYGCFTVDVEAGDTHLHVEAFSQIQRKGVTAKAFPTTPTGFNNETLAKVQWYEAAPSGADLNYTIPASQVWNQVILASLAWHRTGAMHLGQHSSRDCCLSGETHDGSCATPLSDPYTDFGTPMEVRMYAGGNFCGGSSYACDADGNGTIDSDEGFACPGVMVSCPQRMVMAHEQGHVVVEQRMGRRTRMNHHSLIAPISDLVERGCIGQHRPDSPERFAGWDKKGELKEDLQSTAAREGWASFYAAWVFNKYWQDDCTYANALTLYDFDLDGNDFIDSVDLDAKVSVVNMDNDYPANPGYYDCHNHGVGDLGEPDPADPTAAWTAADDWLEAASAGGHCKLADGTIADRGTAYDWVTFFWRMANRPEGQGVPIRELSDLYVDMCPTSWHNSTGVPAHADRRVMNRLLFSAGSNGISIEVDAEKHRGQDH